MRIISIVIVRTAHILPLYVYKYSVWNATVIEEQLMANLWLHTELPVPPKYSKLIDQLRPVASAKTCMYA